MKTYLKRIAAPKSWPIARKRTTYIARPKPSGQPMNRTLPVVVVMRDILNLVETSKQAKRLMHAGRVQVNTKNVHDCSDSIGFMDILTVGDESWRIMINEKNRLTVQPVRKGEEFTVQRIRGKTVLRGGRIQLNCDSGFNTIVEKDTYSIGDSIVVKKGKMDDHLELKKGASVLITGGTHIGVIGNVEDIQQNVLIKTGKEEFETRKEYVYVIGKTKPAFTIEE